MRQMQALAARERRITLAALLAAAGLSLWLSYASGHAAMMGMPHGFTLWGLTFLMWGFMMLAMMLPGAAPAILLYQSMSARLMPSSRAVPAFVAGYGVIWLAFSLIAGTAQVWFVQRGWLDAMALTPLTISLGAGLLIAAGLWQLTPLKEACLTRCREPFMFFWKNWKPGLDGAFRMGLTHGAYCLGCCWLLMALLFYGGVMSPLWIAGLAAYVLVEKLVPPRARLSRMSGALLIIAGAALLIR